MTAVLRIKKNTWTPLCINMLQPRQQSAEGSGSIMAHTPPGKQRKGMFKPSLPKQPALPPASSTSTSVHTHPTHRKGALTYDFTPEELRRRPGRRSVESVGGGMSAKDAVMLGVSHAASHVSDRFG